MSIDLVVEPVLKVLECLWYALARQISYLKNLEENMKILQLKKEELSSKEVDVRTEVNRADTQRKKPTAEALLWLKKVEEIMQKVDDIEKELEKNKRCFPNCYRRLKFGKRVLRTIDEVVSFKDSRPDELLTDSSPNRAQLLPTQSLVGKTTAVRTQEMIWECLMDIKIGKIGVYGMGGAGKTTIMHHINNRLKETKHFDHVIWVTVSQDLSLQRLQNDIGQAVGLELSQCGDELNRAAKLFEKLQKKKFVLILDDMWEKFPLHKAGIPEPKEENGCKLVITTRQRDVCRGMETQREINVVVLSPEEAWELFVKKVGNEVLSPEIQPIAEDVAEECGCLPLAIITVGSAMREENDVRVWRNALNELKNSPTEIRGMEFDVFKPLKFSYSHLRNDQLRTCFLYCAFFPEDYTLRAKELVEYWRAEGLISELGDREAETDKGFAILKELINASMLETSIFYEHVKMHDIIRDLAINIMREDVGFLVKAGTGLKDSPKEEEWAKARKISLMRNHIEHLPDHPISTQLSTLLLRENPLSDGIPHSFFDHMHALKVLDLSESEIRTLPLSLSNLANLHAMFLKNCQRLETLPPFGKLKELRVLDLSNTCIEELPKGLEGLVSLRYLDISSTWRLKTIQLGVIRSLSRLEDLRMHGIRAFGIDSVEASTCIKEMRSLRRLATLTLSIGGFTSFHNAVRGQQWEMLKSFDIIIGDDNLNSLELSNTVTIVNQDIISEAGSLFLPDNTCELVIQNCVIARLSGLLRLSNLRSLKKCSIQECNWMDCFVLENEIEENDLPGLEELNISEMLNLMVLWKGVPPRGSFANLRSLKVSDCHCLKNIFSFELLQQLKNIEFIEIKRCELMEEIVAVGEIVQENCALELPRLQSLVVSELPELHTICRNTLHCDSLTSVEVYSCPKLKKLPFGIDSLSKLEEIQGNRKWWDALEWEDLNAKTFLEPRFKDEGLDFLNLLPSFHRCVTMDNGSPDLQADQLTLELQSGPDPAFLHPPQPLHAAHFKALGS